MRVNVLVGDQITKSKSPTWRVNTSGIRSRFDSTFKLHFRFHCRLIIDKTLSCKRMEKLEFEPFFQFPIW
jgi:hypothetical protein